MIDLSRVRRSAVAEVVEDWKVERFDQFPPVLAKAECPFRSGCHDWFEHELLQDGGVELECAAVPVGGAPWEDREVDDLPPRLAAVTRICNAFDLVDRSGNGSGRAPDTPEKICEESPHVGLKSCR